PGLGQRAAHGAADAAAAAGDHGGGAAEVEHRARAVHAPAPWTPALCRSLRRRNAPHRAAPMAPARTRRSGPRIAPGPDRPPPAPTRAGCRPTSRESPPVTSTGPRAPAEVSSFR